MRSERGLVSVGKNVFNALPEQPGDLERQRQARVVLLRFNGVDRLVRLYAKPVGMCLNLFQFIFGEAASIDNNAMYLVTFILV